MSVDASVGVAARKIVDLSVDWATVYVQFRPTLGRALAAASGSYDGVDDAIQDAFADAVAKDPQGIRSAEAWLFAVALNKLRSHRRRRAVAARLPFAPPARNDLDDALARADISRTLMLLRARERELLVAKYYVGMTQEELARLMGMKRGAVSAAISRAAARFRELEGRGG